MWPIFLHQRVISIITCTAKAGIFCVVHAHDLRDKKCAIYHGLHTDCGKQLFMNGMYDRYFRNRYPRNAQRTYTSRRPRCRSRSHHTCAQQQRHQPREPPRVRSGPQGSSHLYRKAFSYQIVYVPCVFTRPPLTMTHTRPTLTDTCTMPENRPHTSKCTMFASSHRISL